MGQSEVLKILRNVKINSRHIGIFNPRTGGWCRATLKEIQDKFLLMECEGLEDFPPSHSYLCQLAFSFSI